MFGIMSVARQAGQFGGTIAEFDPASVFGASDQGLIFDALTFDALYQASTATTPVTAFGQRPGYATDLSGKGNHEIQTTAANRPYMSGVARSLGPELVTNGRFAADTDWTKGTGYTIGSGIASREYCNVYSVNMTGAAIADQVHIRTRGVVPTQTATGSLNGASALATSRFRIGANSWRGMVSRVMPINRELTAGEISSAETWAMKSRVRACVIGDSTAAITSSPTPNAQRISDFVGGLVTGAADIAEAGSRINGATPITGVDARVTSHVAAGNDGSGNLLAIYDHNADGVHESNEYRIIIAHAWRTALESLGLLEAAA